MYVYVQDTLHPSKCITEAVIAELQMYVYYSGLLCYSVKLFANVYN